MKYSHNGWITLFFETRAVDGIWSESNLLYCFVRTEIFVTSLRKYLSHQNLDLIKNSTNEIVNKYVKSRPLKLLNLFLPQTFIFL